jgi:hypothetical protein
MAPALINKPVLASNPAAANCNTYILGLVGELRVKIDALPVVPGAAVPVDSTTVLELRGVSQELSVALRNLLKWAA